jgi:hypothetical protein
MRGVRVFRAQSRFPRLQPTDRATKGTLVKIYAPSR